MKTKKKTNKPISRIKRNWLKVLKQAVDEGVKIKVNHKFIYKGKRLGTFLVDAKRNGSDELIEEIKKIGVDFTFHSHKPEDVVKRFMHQLWNDPAPHRHGASESCRPHKSCHHTSSPRGSCPRCHK